MSRPDTEQETDTIDVPQNQYKPTRYIIRIAASIVDSIMLGLVGFLIYLTAGSFYVDKPLLGLLTGLVISVVYFGLLESKIGRGQSIGKELLKIKVVDKNGEKLSVLRSSARMGVISFSTIFNGVQFPPTTVNLIVLSIVGVGLFGSIVSNVYLLIFNRKSKQLIHDIVTSSFVVPVGNSDIVSVRTPKAHIIVCSVVFALMLGPIIYSKYNYDSGFISGVGAYESINDLPKVVSASVMQNTSTTSDLNGESNTSKSLIVSCVINNDNLDDENLLSEIKQIMINEYEEVYLYRKLNVSFTYRVNLGIYKTNKRKSHVLNLEGL